MTRRRAARGATLRVVAVCAAAGVAACDDDSTAPLNQDAGFLTSAPAFARLAPGVAGDLVPLVSVGDSLPGSGARLAPKPDGIGVFSDGAAVGLMLNHELKGVTALDGREAFAASRVSRFALNPTTMGALRHTYVIDGSEGYRSLCSATWAGPAEGFPGGVFFTGEETEDGLQLAVDTTGRVLELPWIGRYAHENQIAVPGFPGHAVVLNFDDRSGSGSGVAASRSELYLYVAATGQDVLAGTGQLYVFAASGVAHPGELVPGQSVGGSWIAVPDAVARDFAALEQFGDDTGAFPFVRLEDGFYDKRPGAAPAAYFFDTGRGSIVDSMGAAWDPWGSIYRLAFTDRDDPAGGGATLTLLARSSGPAAGWASPDNGDMNASGVLMLQEDPANSPWTRRPAIFAFRVGADGRLVDDAGTPVVEAVEPDDAANALAVVRWETSGIVDASPWFGPDTWVFDVQAHSKPVPALNLAEEHGQLLFLRLK